MSMPKAQAAMEFLMTYGWALLVTLIALGALVYFNAFSPKGVLPDQCVLFPGMSCYDPYATNPGPIFFKFTIQNVLGYTMQSTHVGVNVIGVPASILGATLTSINAINCAPTDLANYLTIKQDEAKTCGYRFTNLPSYGLGPGSVLKGEIILTWYDLANQQRKRSGSFIMTIQAA